MQWPLLVAILISSEISPSAKAGDVTCNQFDQQFKRLKSLNRENCDSNEAPQSSIDLKIACQDLASLTCKPGARDDGTGKYHSEAEITLKVDAMQSKMKQSLKTAIENALNSNNEKYDFIRRLAPSAVLQSKTPDCLSTSEESLKKCHAQTADLLSDLYSRRLFIGYDLTGLKDGVRKQTGDTIQMDAESIENLALNLSFKNIIAPAQEQAKRELEQVDQINKVKNDVFPRVKAILIEKIKVQVSDPVAQKKIIQKLNNISFNPKACDGINIPGGPSVDPLFVRNAYYSSMAQEFRFCNGLLMESDSEFMLVGVIAHELAHSFDPCNVSRPAALGVNYSNLSDLKKCEEEYPLTQVMRCLRTPESIGATRAEWYWSKARREAAANRARFSNPVPNPFCSGDQIGESMSDWMSAEVLPDYMKKHHPELTTAQKAVGYSNVLRSTCEPRETVRFDAHPLADDRINRILLANPKIFEDMGCKDEDRSKLKKPVYCKAGAPVKGKSLQQALEQAADDFDEKSRNPTKEKSNGEQKP